MTQTWSLWLKCSTSSVTNSRFTLLYICYEHICQQMTYLSSVNNSRFTLFYICHHHTYTLASHSSIKAHIQYYEDTYIVV
jgi:hypothetical protein